MTRFSLTTPPRLQRQTESVSAWNQTKYGLSASTNVYSGNLSPIPTLAVSTVDGNENHRGILRVTQNLQSQYLRLKWRAGGPSWGEKEKKGGKLPLKAKSLRKLYALIEKIRYVEYGG